MSHVHNATLSDETRRSNRWEENDSGEKNTIVDIITRKEESTMGERWCTFAHCAHDGIFRILLQNTDYSQTCAEAVDCEMRKRSEIIRNRRCVG